MAYSFLLLLTSMRASLSHTFAGTEKNECLEKQGGAQLRGYVSLLKVLLSDLSATGTNSCSADSKACVYAYIYFLNPYLA